MRQSHSENRQLFLLSKQQHLADLRVHFNPHATAARSGEPLKESETEKQYRNNKTQGSVPKKLPHGRQVRRQLKRVVYSERNTMM
jgi:hypothetical protein